MAAGALLPAGYETLEDANGVTVPGGLIWSYAAGTTTPLATYTDSTLVTPNANPIIADGAGRWTAYAAPGTGFKLVFETPAIPPAHGATIKTVDNIVAPLTDATAGATGGVTVISDNTTGTVNNFVLTGRTKDTLWSWNGSADLTITGIAGGSSGDRLTIKNMSTVANRKILFAHMSASSTNPFYNIAVSAPTPIAPSGYATYEYVGGTWVMVDHEQGDPLSAVYNALNYGGVGGMGWAVDAGDVTAAYYVLRGRTVLFTFTLINTSVVAPLTGSLVLFNTLWGSFAVSPSFIISGCIWAEVPGGLGLQPGWMQNSGTTAVLVAKLSTANWVATTNQTNVYGQLWIAVQ